MKALKKITAFGDWLAAAAGRGEFPRAGQPLVDELARSVGRVEGFLGSPLCHPSARARAEYPGARGPVSGTGGVAGHPADARAQTRSVADPLRQRSRPAHRRNAKGSRS